MSARSSKQTKLDEVMTKNPKAIGLDTTIQQAAQLMRDEHIGSIVVTDGTGSPCGMVTDRDLVTRGIAEKRDPSRTRVGDVCSRDPSFLGPDDTIDDAVELMTKRSIRRVPVIDKGNLVGIVSLGDLAEERDPGSALGEISAAPPNN